MAPLRFALLAALCAAAVAQAPACEQARSDCAASCAGDSLDVAAFLCRETVFGLLTSCSCAPPKPPAPSSEVVFVESDSDSSASDSSSASDYFSSSSSSAEPAPSSSSSDVAFTLPRRFGPLFFPAGPMFIPGQPQPQADPFAAARTAFLNDVLARSGRPTQPSLVMNFDVQQPAEGMIFFVREEQPGRDPRLGPQGPEDSDSDLDEMDMGAGCAIMTLATVAFFVGLITCCVRACLAACPRRAAVARRSHQILVDCTAGELSSPLLVVEDAEKDMVTVVAPVRSS